MSVEALKPPVPSPSDRVAATRVIVGLSGGVDSSVAAWLLRRQGHRVQGLFMKNWEGDDTEAHCAAEADYRDARAVCEALEVPLYGVNFAQEYWDRVFAHFLREYAAGRTPNPDVLCNKEIKFRAFLDHARALGAEFIATGHYARRAPGRGGYRLLKARDTAKDQSYFLYTLGQAQLSRSLFPLGELTKPQVRRLAAACGLVTHAKKDSTGICFIGERRFKTFLQRYLPARPGEIRTPEGEPLGRHEGLMYYTLGQRQGLGLGGRRGAGTQPWYVVGKNLPDNVLLVAQGRDHPLLYSDWLEAADLHWVAGRPPGVPWQGHAKTRYRQADQACRIEWLEAGRCRVRFQTPQWAVTPGQSVVFYAGDECLGGGVIERSGRGEG